MSYYYLDDLSIITTKKKHHDMKIISSVKVKQFKKIDVENISKNKINSKVSK